MIVQLKPIGRVNKTKWAIARALKWSIFIVQKLALHKNGVEFHQKFNGTILTSLTAPYNDVGRCTTLLKTHLLTKLDLEQGTYGNPH